MRRVRRLGGIWYLLMAYLFSEAQDSSRLSISAYLEPYYTYDFSKPSTHTRPGYVYSYNRIEEVTVNLALIRLAYHQHRTRGNIGIMAGTYANTNLAAEPGVFKNLFEANAGFRLNRSKELWVDVGILPSHIGWETAIGKDNWTLTRSMAADNSPYYEAGARLSYSSPNAKWHTALLVLNGWQRIQRVEGNHTLAWGSQVTYKPSDNLQINSSTFVGSDQPDSTRQMRYFHDLYSTMQVNNHIGITMGFDVGAHQKAKGARSLNYWYTPVLLLRGKISETMFVTGRIEYYHDKYGVIISSANGEPFSVWGHSVNWDWQPVKKLLWRLEVKCMCCKNRLFSNNQGDLKKVNFTGTTSLCYSF